MLRQAVELRLAGALSDLAAARRAAERAESDRHVASTAAADLGSRLGEARTRAASLEAEVARAAPARAEAMLRLSPVADAVASIGARISEAIGAPLADVRSMLEAHVHVASEPAEGAATPGPGQMSG